MNGLGVRYTHHYTPQFINTVEIKENELQPLRF